MKVLTRKYTGIRGILTLLMVLVGAVIVRAENSLPDVPAFGADVRGILLLNGWTGDHTEQNAALLESLTKQGINSVLALDVSVDRPEDLSVIQQTYHASVVLWWSAADVHFAVFAPAPLDEMYVQEDFAPFIEPDTFVIAGLNTEAAAGTAQALWFYTWQNYTASAAALALVLETVPAREAAALYLYRGLSYAHQANYEAAKTDFARISATSELAAWAQYNNGSALYRNHDYTGAIAEYTMAAHSTGERALLHTIYASRGEAYRLQGDTDQAVGDFSQAIEMANTSADVYQNRGKIFFDEGDYERALKDYNRWLALSPNNLLAWQYRAQLYIKTGDYDLAIEDYTAVIKLAHEINWLCQCLYAHRAEVYHLDGQYDMAIADYQQSLGYGEYMKSRLGLAQVYIDVNEPEKALEQLRAAEAIPGASSSDYLSIGGMYQALDDSEGAGSAYLKWINAIQYERIDEDTISARSGSLELDMSQGRAYYIPVTMRAGKTLTVNATASDAGLDPLIVILDTDGQPVSGSDDISDTNNNAEISAFKPVIPGQYTIVVTHAGGGSFGTVDLSWSKRR